MSSRFFIFFAFLFSTFFPVPTEALQFFFPDDIPETFRSQQEPEPKPSHAPNQSTSRPPSPNVEIIKAQQALQELKTKPDEFRVLVLGVQIFLGRFGYGTGPFNGELDDTTREALKAYQQYVGLPVTGEIDYYTLEKLTNDNKALDQILPYLPPRTVQTQNWNESVHIQGTWTVKGEDAPNVPQTTTIDCSRVWNRCVETTAGISNTHTPYLSLKTHVHEIGTWDEKYIVTRPNSSEACTSAIIRIDRKRQNVTRLLSIQPDSESCRGLKNADIHYQLGDGPKIYWGLKQRKAELTKKILRVKP